MENIFSLRIKKDKVIETINQGAGIGITIAIMTIVYALLIGPYLVGIDSISKITLLIICGIVTLFSIGIYFKSRFCAVSLLVVYFIDIIFLFISGILSKNSSATYNPAISGIIIHIFFFIILLRGTKAIFIYHKYIKNRNDTRKK